MKCTPGLTTPVCSPVSKGAGAGAGPAPQRHGQLRGRLDGQLSQLRNTVDKTVSFVSDLKWLVMILGVLVLLWATFLIDHFDLFGLRQSWMNLLDRPLVPLVFRTTLLYRVVRHPIMLGFLIAFWFTPHMTAGHLLFATGMTVYILIGVRHEERDLVEALGPAYAAYRRETPAFVPGLPGASDELPAESSHRTA